jgi:Lrp/AsnC family leucine-responsive transcriptional regulator
MGVSSGTAEPANCTLGLPQWDCNDATCYAHLRNNIASSTALPTEMATPTLDKTDRKLLDLLQKDGRMTNLDLAGRVALSPSACLRRVRSLEEAGVIRGYAALLDPAKIGLGLLAFVTVKLEKRGRMPTDAFARACRDWPEVAACHATTGDMDYLLRVHVEDLPHFSRFVMDSLLKHPGVIDVKSSFVLEQVKETTALPLARTGS